MGQFRNQRRLHKRIKAGISAPSLKYFKGELMTCCLCGATEQSDPAANLNWRVLEADGTPYYFCRAHFPPDGSTVKAFKLAYETCLARVLQLRSAK